MTAPLEQYNSQLIESLQALKAQRSALGATIQAELEEKACLEKELLLLTEHLKRTTDYLNRKLEAKAGYDSAILETESAYSKILESSHTLLHVLKRESANFSKTATD